MQSIFTRVLETDTNDNVKEVIIDSKPSQGLLVFLEVSEHVPFISIVWLSWERATFQRHYFNQAYLVFVFLFYFIIFIQTTFIDVIAYIIE